MTDLVLGIDGGGTKTDVALVDRDGGVLKRLRRPGVDPTAGPGWEAGLAAIAAEIGPVAHAVLGLPFHGEIADISARQIEVAKALFGTGARVMNDVEAAFHGALAGQDGVLILAGTGSMAWARGRLGTHRVGGWGDLFGDEGSAFWIGRAALARVSQEIDGRRPDRTFADALLAGVGVSAEAFSGWAHGLTPARAGIAALAQRVSELAAKGNPGAAELMAEATQALAELGLTAARLSGAGNRWSIAGGVMADPIVRKVLAERMGSEPVAPALPPVGGAVLAAASDARWATGDAFIKRLGAALEPQLQLAEPATAAGTGGHP
jgi:N-acetylglucosamine kinase